jgi:hypothetical protein
MKNTMFNNYETLIKEAKILIDDGENIEYTRGVLELICSFISFDDENCHADNVIMLAKEIDLSNDVINNLY